MYLRHFLFLICPPFGFLVGGVELRRSQREDQNREKEHSWPSSFRLLIFLSLWGLNIVILWAKGARTKYMKNWIFNFSRLQKNNGTGHSCALNRKPCSQQRWQNEENKTGNQRNIKGLSYSLKVEKIRIWRREEGSSEGLKKKKDKAENQELKLENKDEDDDDSFRRRLNKKVTKEKLCRWFLFWTVLSATTEKKMYFSSS